MAAIHTTSDALTIYHTAADEGITQPDPTLCLGGFKSATEVQGKSYFVTKSMPPLVIDAVSGKLASGTHTITAQTTSTVTFTASGGTASSAVTINDGDSVLLVDGTDDDMWVRVSRISSGGLLNSLEFETYNNIDNVIAQRDVTNAEMTAGLTIYKAVMFQSVGAVSAVKAWVADSKLAIGIEAPTANAIQIIANETTAPAAISFSSPTTEGTGLVPVPGTDGLYGLWLRIAIPAGGGTYDNIQTVTLHVKFTIGGTDYFNDYVGIFRMADDALKLYRLYESVDDAAYDFNTPDATSATLPFDFGIASPVSGTRKYGVVVRYQNEYGLESQNIYERETTIDDAGVEQLSPISTPTNQDVSETTNGNLLAKATYAVANDADPADTWAIYITGDGTTPDPVTGTPVTVAMGSTPSLFSGKELSLSSSLGPFGQGATIKAIIRARRASDGEESSNTNVFSNVITTITPCIVYKNLTFSGNTYGQVLTPPTLADSPVTTVWDGTNNIRSIITPGRHELWGDSVLIFRINYDDFDASVNGFWTTFGVKQETITGSGTGVVETGSWTGPDKHLFINVGTERRMKIDVTNSLISVAALVQNPVKVWKTKSSVPIVSMGDVHTLLQAWDRGTFDYATAAHLDNFGVLNLGVGWRQRATTGEFL